MNDMARNIAVDFPDLVVDLMMVGIVAIDRRMNIILWNRFMEMHSQMSAEEVLGKNIFDCFPELPKNWLEKKIKGVIVLKNTTFTSWRETPYLFKFSSPTVITGGSRVMYQDCGFWPLKDGDGVIHGACLSIHDVTEVAVTQQLLEEATEKALSMEESSQRDGLTGLYNRRFFDEQITQEIIRARRYCWELTLFILDIDHFKKVNDTYGHQGGDTVLKVFALEILKQLRASDVMCRYGGEEFAIILPQVDKEKALAIAERLRRKIENTAVAHEEHKISFTSSFGVAILEEGSTPGQLISQADQALYHSKRSGRNRVTLFSEIPKSVP
jgi:diguanylate cyclase (GGDEF)-like protein